MSSQHSVRAIAAKQRLHELIIDCDARSSEKRVMLAALDELWLVLVDDAPVYPSPLGAFHDAAKGKP